MTLRPCWPPAERSWPLAAVLGASPEKTTTSSSSSDGFALPGRCSHPRPSPKNPGAPGVSRAGRRFFLFSPSSGGHRHSTGPATGNEFLSVHIILSPGLPLRSWLNGRNRGCTLPREYINLLLEIGKRNHSPWKPDPRVSTRRVRPAGPPSSRRARSDPSSRGPFRRQPTR